MLIFFLPQPNLIKSHTLNTIKVFPALLWARNQSFGFNCASVPGHDALCLSPEAPWPAVYNVHPQPPCCNSCCPCWLFALSTFLGRLTVNATFWAQKTQIKSAGPNWKICWSYINCCCDHTKGSFFCKIYEDLVLKKGRAGLEMLKCSATTSIHHQVKFNHLHILKYFSPLAPQLS